MARFTALSQGTYSLFVGCFPCVVHDCLTDMKYGLYTAQHRRSHGTAHQIWRRGVHLVPNTGAVVHG
jgi:hypothetical protein